MIIFRVQTGQVAVAKVAELKKLKTNSTPLSPTEPMAKVTGAEIVSQGVNYLISLVVFFSFCHCGLLSN